jgi:GntR family L-lactate dehydrogenase operon transcriptional regulator
MDPEIQYLLLSLLESQIVPLGAGATREALAAEGIEVGEATAGRMLRDLQHEGLAAKVGVQGRVLTEKGRERLRKLRLEKEQTRSAREFVSTLQATDYRELEDVLVARRAIEAETARLAAENATEEEIRTLEEIVEEMQGQLLTGKGIAISDERFHLHLARMCKNPVLETALKLIRHNGRYSPLFEKIRNRAGTLTGRDHLRIVRAVAARDGEAAGRAMIDHINGVLKDVRRMTESSEPVPAGDREKEGKDT